MLCFINKLKQDAGTPLVNGTYKNHASHLQSQSQLSIGTQKPWLNIQH